MPDFRRILVQRLESLHRAGVQQGPRLVLAPESLSGQSRPAAVTPPPTRTQQPHIAPATPPPPVRNPDLPSSAPRTMPKPARPTVREDSLLLRPYPKALKTLGERQAALDLIRTDVRACNLCQALCYRTQTVFGVGNVKPRVVFFGEAPGADEDKQGEPFVGRAGQLLTKIIEACGWKREDVYILNTLKCRPPDNRTPAEDEIANCRPFWEQQLETLHPEFIVCLGAVAAQALLETTVSIGKLRGKFHPYRDSQVVATYHPAYLLRNPDAKRFVWEDMQMLMREMGQAVPKTR